LEQPHLFNPEREYGRGFELFSQKTQPKDTLTRLLFSSNLQEHFQNWTGIMARMCDICGKGVLTGNKVSHAKNRTRRTWRPNLVKLKTEQGGTTVTLHICARCLKSEYVNRKISGLSSGLSSGLTKEAVAESAVPATAV
jgi:large subunit ribosomal protein L28